MSVLDHLIPKEVFYYFEQISNIPRGSGNEKAVSEYLVEFAKSNCLEYIQDKYLNVIIKKPGTPGYEKSQPVILQGHMDMVCEKNRDTIHDFENDALVLRVDGDYISAEGTTLGADNGIAVAYALAVLASNDLAHPPIEAVFTTDEEVGMNGASGLDMSKLTARRLINMDSEEEGKLLVSCAGGMKAAIHLPTKYETINSGKVAYTIQVRGLKGGHSGTDIDKQRANSNKLIGRLLSILYKKFSINIATISGGAKDNAIPREADATICINPSDLPDIKTVINDFQSICINEFKKCDLDINIGLIEASQPIKIFDLETTKKVIDILVLIPNGILNMSLDIEGLVESSNNIGVVSTLDNEVVFTCAVRSSVSTRKEQIKNQLEHLSDLVGAKLTIKGEYPAWEYKEQSKLREVFIEVHNKMYHKAPEIEAIHAGLECGLFAQKIPDIDMISIGPEMADVHTPDERLSISSTARTWEYLIEVLKALKD